MRLLAPTLSALLFVSVLAPPAWAKTAERIQVETVSEREVTRFKKLAKLLSENKIADVTVILEELLRASQAEQRDLQVPINATENKAATHFRGFRELVLTRLMEMPMKVRKAIARGHEAAVRGLKSRSTEGEGSSERFLREIVESYPLAPQARDAALRLAELAFERDDLVAAMHYDHFVERFHRFGKVSWSTRARQCLTAARLGQPKRAQTLLRILKASVEKTKREDLMEFANSVNTAAQIFLRGASTEKAPPEFPQSLALKNPRLKDSKITFWKPQKAATDSSSRRGVIIIRGGRRVQSTGTTKLVPPRFHPTVRGDDIYISNGRRIFVYSASTGKRRAILPFFVGEEISSPPPPGMQTEVIAFGSLLISNLYLPRTSASLSRERVLNGQGFGTNYGSMVLFDASRGHKIVYWEGDRGPGQAEKKKVAEQTVPRKRSLKSVIDNGHVLGLPALCGQRIYTGMVVNDGEPEIWVVAFDRGQRSGEDLGVELVPIWATFIGVHSSNQNNKDIPNVFPSVSLSGDQVYCHTGTSTISALNALDGRLKWSVHSAEIKEQKENNGRNRFVFRGGRLVNPDAVTEPHREPLRFIERPNLPDLVIVAPPGGKEVTAYDSLSGKIAWSTRRQRSSSDRFFVTKEGLVIRYGDRELIAIDGRSGKLCSMAIKGSFNDHKHLPSSESVKFRGDITDGRLLLPVGKGRVRLVKFSTKRVGDYDSLIVEFDIGDSIKLVGTKEDGHVSFTNSGMVMASRDRLWIFGLPKKE